MPLTEINVTNPPPVFRNAWAERAARRAALPPPPPWSAVDPGLLEEGRPRLPVFPLTVFPAQWREWVKDAAQWAGSSEDYIAQALLASVAGLCGQGVSARITEAWSEPVILWQALVGGPSSGKTPALEWLRRPLGTVERVMAREGGAPVGTGDGLAARFLYAWPGPVPYRSLRTLKPTREDEAVNALQRIARAVGTPEKPLVLSFEDRAVTAFDVSLERLHPETLKAEGFMAGWLGKGRGTVARLAAVLALLDWTANRPNNAPPPTVITTQHLCAAWDLWERYYRPHAQAVFDRAGPADGDRQGKHKTRQHARRVIGWIRPRGVKEISREEVRREALSQRVNAAGADEVILALEQAGVLREVEVDEEDYPARGRPARRWQVNPALRPAPAPTAKPTAQIAETPSLPSAAGEVSPSYGDEGVGSHESNPSGESLARIAEKQTSPASKEAGKADWPK